MLQVEVAGGDEVGAGAADDGVGRRRAEPFGRLRDACQVGGRVGADLVAGVRGRRLVQTHQVALVPPLLLLLRL